MPAIYYGVLMRIFLLKTILGGFLALNMGLALAAGVGVSADSDDQAVFIPIDVSERFRIEPYISYTDSENSNKSKLYDLSGAEPVFLGTFVNSTSTTSYTFAIGFFKKQMLAEQLQTYYGARIGIVNSENQQTNKSVSASGVEGDKSIRKGETDGVLMAPVLGFEFFFIPKFSLGAEVAIERIDGETKTDTEPFFTGVSSRSDTSRDFTTVDTRGKVNIRYYF